MESRSFSRRGFARCAAVLTVGAPLAQPDPAAAPAGTGEAEARLANIVRQYGSRLSREQVAHLRKILAENEHMLAAVRGFPLENGDTPASVLKLRPGSEQ